MKRINLPDGTWFDREACDAFWDYEKILKTKTGKYVLEESSQWQGSRATYRVLTNEDAAAWLLRHGHEAEAEKVSPGIAAKNEI